VPQWYDSACGPVKRARSFAPVTPFLAFLLGLLLGPALGILGWMDMAAAGPFVALACGAAGAALAARLDAHARRPIGLAAAALAAGAVAIAVGIVLRLQPATAAVLGGSAATALVLAGVAVAPRSPLAPLLLAVAVTLAPGRRGVMSLGLWIVFLVLAPALTALLYRALLSRAVGLLPPAAAGVALLAGAGVGAATGVSPLLACWGAALALGAAAPARSALRVLVLDAEQLATALLWFAAGVIAAVPSLWVVVVSGICAGMPPLLGRLVRHRWIGAARLAEPVALALAWAVALMNPRGLGAAAPLVTTVALAGLAVLAGPVLYSRAERLTRRRGPVEVSA